MRKPFHFVTIALVVAVAMAISFQAATVTPAEEIPATLSDPEFWRLATEFSETGGQFSQQWMSNEDSALFVIPPLKDAIKHGGIYLGVGPEQNFTYIAAVRPRLSFILDIRRDNMIELLLYKALFELSANRAEFVSRLFSRKQPVGLKNDATVQALFDAYHSVEADADLYAKTLREVTDRLAGVHKFALSDADKKSLEAGLTAFRTAGPDSLKGFGDRTNPTYAEMMAAKDLTGKQQSYLASEANFRIVQDLQKKNLIVPLVGDFAGEKAIRSIGKYLKDRRAAVSVFYLSNVERYLFEQGDDSRKFYANVAALPLDSSSLFIRSVTSDISRRQGFALPDAPTKWRTLLSPMQEFLKAVDAGKIQTYGEVFTILKK